MATEGSLRGYRPSWIDRFTDWVERLPGPGWSYYLGIQLIAFLVGLAVLWGEGTIPIGQLYPLHIFISLTMGYFPVLIHYLDHQAGTALKTIRPLLKVDDAEYNDHHYRLTTLPAWPTLLISGFVLLLPLVVDEIRRAADRPDIFAALGVSTVSYWLMYVFYRLLWWVFGTLIYHTAHQLRQIHHIYTAHTHINIFRAGPLYAFSSITALTAAGLVLPPYVFIALNPEGLGDPITIAYMLPITALALATFVWPQLGVRRLMAEQKGQMLDAHAVRLEAALVELRQRVDARETKEIDDVIKAISALDIEENRLRQVSTWPWKPETLRYLTSALFLPLVMWFIQFVLQSLLAN
jgi:hypothetical protein